MSKYRTFDQYLIEELKDYKIEELKDRSEAKSFLKAAIEEYNKDGDHQTLMLALRIVVESQGGVASLVEGSRFNRQNLYKILTGKTIPRFDTILSIIKGLGFELDIKKSESYKKNHFIPKFYLKQWHATDKDFFFAYNYDAQKKIFKPIKGQKNHGNTNTYINNLYQSNTEIDSHKNLIEKSFGKKESNAARVFKKLSSEKDSVHSLTLEEKVELLLFILNLRIRSPHIVTNLKSEEKIKESENLLKYFFLKQGGTFQEYYTLTSNKEVRSEIDNLPLSVFIEGFNKSASNFLRNRFGKGNIYICDTSKSQFSLITSNFPVIDGKSLFSKDGYDIVFPLSPNKIFFIISEDSLREFKKIMQLSINDLVINTNTAILENHNYDTLEVGYQIYTNSDQKEKILPDSLISKYFFPHSN
jgi:DNA-binding phage protein